MALKASIYKAELQIADLQRHYYASQLLTLACHPSETEQRMMLRLLAYALYADDALQFTRGLSCDEEPDLWRKSLDGRIEQWIELGQPDERRLRQAAGQSQQQIVISYGDKAARHWFEGLQKKLSRHQGLSIIHISDSDCTALAGLAAKTMQLQCTIDGDQVWLNDPQQSVAVSLERWYPR